MNSQWCREETKATKKTTTKGREEAGVPRRLCASQSTPSAQSSNGLLNSFKLIFHSGSPADGCNLDVWKTNLELFLANFGSGMARFSAIHHGQHMT